METLFGELSDVLVKGEEAVLATIIASLGSTPRGAGSRMLVKKGGTIKGTVGGDAMKYQTILTAVEVIEYRSSYTKGFTLTKSQVADVGMVYGENAIVHFQCISPDNEEFTGFCVGVRTTSPGDGDSWLLLDITDETCWQMGLYSESIGLLSMNIPERFIDSDLFGYSTFQREAEGCRRYVEPLVQVDAVYVFGEGHVAQGLVPVLIHVGFRYVVMDDREEPANPQVFPTTTDTIMGNLERVGDCIKIRPYDYICVMIREHQSDYYVQKQTMTFRPRYIGIMGSRDKMRVVTDKLLGDGSSREEIEGCHMSIRIEIHAEIPVGIVISIAGELVGVRTMRTGSKSKIGGQK